MSKIKRTTQPASDRSLKYYCKRCNSAKSIKVVTLFPEIDGKRDKGIDSEIITIIENEEGKEVKVRTLECNHTCSYFTPGFKDTSENLSEAELQEIRRKIQMEIVGKNQEEIEQIILFHVEQYKVLLNISSKQMKQARYGLQELDSMREKYVKNLSKEDQNTFEMKFAKSLDQTYKSNKEIVLEDKKKKEQEKPLAAEDALAAVRALLAKKGFNAKELGLKDTIKAKE